MPEISICSIYINNDGSEFLYLFPAKNLSEVTLDQIKAQASTELAFDDNEWNQLYKNGETSDGEASLTFFGPTTISLKAPIRTIPL